MSLTVETGAGIAGAESYASVTSADTYWAKRAHTAFATSWAAGTTGNKEGALREATAYIDATYGNYYLGQRAGYVQGLLWPRTNACDDDGYYLPALPQCLIDACCELAARALSARLASDAEHGGKVKREMKQIGDLKKEIEYMGSATADKRYGYIDGLLAAILNGSQPSAGGASWNWR